MFIFKVTFVIFLLVINYIQTFDLNDKLVSALVTGVSNSNNNNNNNNLPPKQTQTSIPNIASRLGEPVLLECGASEHELLKQLESSVPSMPVLVNWFKHYSLTRRSDKPIYAKYLANNIDYAPHISRDYENRIQVVNKINLNISSLKATDEALYECRLILFDKAYADSQTGSMFYLQVHIAPEFEYPNEEIVYFKPNIPIRLYCYAKGKPTPTITWYKNGKQLEANTSVLQETFSMLENLDMFEYRCKAENLVGQIEHTVKVIRSGSLFFTEPLKNLTVTEGTILNWPCLAQSNAEITYKWFKDSVSVQSHLHKWSDRGALFQDGMLYLLETYRNDSGLYECHAFTANKRIETSAYLNVLYGPEILPFPSPFYAFEGSHSIVIDCVVKSNPGVIALEWFKDKYLLSNTNKYQILPNNSLMIRNVQKADRGHYYCSCNNTIKKAVSPIIRIEIIDSRKVEILTFYSSSTQNFYKLPCKPLLSSFSGISSEQVESIINSDNVNWFKLNSKLPQNRYSVDLNGSLILYNLRSSDSGFYLCKINEEFLQNNQDTFKNRSKSIIQYSIERSISSNEKLIKLNVVQNKSSSDSFSSEANISEFNSNNNNNNELTNTELPLCPENIQTNQTKNGILVSWTYPNNSQIKIEYFQIYFREINDKFTANQLGKKTNLVQQSSHNYEWKTTESINSNQNSYLIDELDLQDGQLYEFQLVSFSAFSKSLPSKTIKIRYKPNEDMTTLKQPNSVQFTYHSSTSTYLSSLNNFFNLSQLDIILIAIFFILVFILVICIIACIFYRRSSKNCRKKQNLKKGELDDWGFQSSSAATATFLSSSSSSDKSLNSYKNKMLRSSAVDCDLINKNKNEKMLNNEDNDEDSPNETNETITNNDIEELNRNRFKLSNTMHNEAEDIFENDDYYYSRPKNLNQILNKQRNPSNFSSATSTGISSSLNTNSTCASSSSSSSTTSNHPINSSSSNSSSESSHSPNLINTSGTSSSGITSVSATSSIINSDDNNDEHNDKLLKEIIPINTIKYNAKTNILQTQPKSKKFQIKSKKQFLKRDTLDSKNYFFKSNISQIKHPNKEYIVLDSNYSNDKQPGCILNQNCIKLNSSLKCQKQIDIESNLNEYFGPNEYSGVSIDVDESSSNETCSNKAGMNQQWMNDTISPSTVTPMDSSNYSNSPLQASPSSLMQTKNYPLPFPTTHFNLKQGQSRIVDIQQQLDSNSSLTTVSKMPSSSCAYLINNELNNQNQLKATKAFFTSDPSSASSSGCSSLENQTNNYFPKPIIDQTHRFYSTINPKQKDVQKKNVNFSNRNSLYSDSSLKQTNNKKYQQYSTYRPVIKSSLLNSNSNSTNSPNNSSENQNPTPIKKPNNTNTSTFRPSKVDYV